MVASVGVCLDSRQRVFALVSAMAGMVENALDQAIEALLASRHLEQIADHAVSLADSLMFWLRAG